MAQIALIAAGGALGALLRFWVQQAAFAALGRGFPYGTMLANVVGSFLMGFLYFYVTERTALSREIQLALFVGLLGAFTTFSTFSFDTVTLLEAGRGPAALANVVASVSLCLAACWLGVLLVRQV